MVISPALVDITAEAVLQAYSDYADGPVVAPDGYAAAGTTFYGWEGLDPHSPATAKKFALVFRSTDTPGSYLVAFRGTDTPDEWIANADFPTSVFPDSPGIDVASGFLDLYVRSMPGANPPALRDSLIQYFKSVAPKEIIVAGHSLGSALAAMFAYDVSTNLNIKPTLITYACPNVGKQAWAAAFNAAVPDAVRIYNNQDIVPYLPPTNLGYVSVGANWEVTFNPQFPLYRAVPTALVTNHSMFNYEYVVGHAATDTPQTWAGPFADQSTDTTWIMQSSAPTPGATAVGLTMALAHLDFLKQLKAIHGII